MNKIFLLLLILVAPNLFAEDLEPSPDVVDPMASMKELGPTDLPDEVELAPETLADKPDETVKAMVEAAAIPAPEAVSVSAPIPEPAPLPRPIANSSVQIDEQDDFNPRKGHWVTTFGFEGLEYEVPLEFIGVKETFKDETRQLYGGRLGFGREFYLGWGFNTTTKLEGFYVGTLFEKATNAGPEQEAEEYAYIKRTGQIYGGEINQSLGMVFDFHTKNPFLDQMTYMTLEPFVFAGFGRARTYNRLSYHYDTTIDEDYRATIEDSLNTTSVGGGFNLTSLTGFFLYLKATQYRYNVTKRREHGYSDPDGAGNRVDFNTTTTDDVDVKPTTIYAIGGGYKF